MRARWPGALSTLIGALALCATADARQVDLTFGPFEARGYAVTGALTPVTHDEYSLRVRFQRRALGEEQSHTYYAGFVQVRHDRALSRATAMGTLITGKPAALGSTLGRISMAFRSTGREVGAACGGRRRPGVLSGSFLLHADTTFFGTLARDRLPAALSVPGRRCGARRRGAPETLLLAGFASPNGAPGATYSLRASDPGGHGPERLDLELEQSLANDGAVVHRITASGRGRSLFEHGHGRGASLLGAGPFLRGSARFTPSARCSRRVDGVLSGDLTARFDSYGPWQPFAGGPQPARLDDRSARC